MRRLDYEASQVCLVFADLDTKAQILMSLVALLNYQEPKILRRNRALVDGKQLGMTLPCSNSSRGIKHYGEQ